MTADVKTQVLDELKREQGLTVSQITTRILVPNPDLSNARGLKLLADGTVPMAQSLQARLDVNTILNELVAEDLVEVARPSGHGYLRRYYLKGMAPGASA